MPRETLRSLAARSAFAGRTAIVTGGAGAFGSAALRVLRYLGADAIGVDQISGPGILTCDVTDDEQVRVTVGEAVERLGRLDTLCEVASTLGGTVAFRLARHAPGLVDRVVAARMRHLVKTKALDGAAIAADLRERHGARGAAGVTNA